jgi:4Fe-4S ferredoxin
MPRQFTQKHGASEPSVNGASAGWRKPATGRSGAWRSVEKAPTAALAARSLRFFAKPNRKMAQTRSMLEGAECKETGRLVPVIDSRRCEGKADCVRVCPYQVFTVRSLTDSERSALGPLIRFKVFVHGGKQAFVERGVDCHACGKCVPACPEKAIKLRAVG